MKTDRAELVSGRKLVRKRSPGRLSCATGNRRAAGLEELVGVNRVIGETDEIYYDDTGRIARNKRGDDIMKMREVALCDCEAYSQAKTGLLGWSWRSLCEQGTWKALPQLRGNELGKGSSRSSFYAANKPEFYLLMIDSIIYTVKRSAIRSSTQASLSTALRL